MRVKLENGEIAEDGYHPVFGYGGYNNYLGQDSGVRSRDMETLIHKQGTMSRLDEKTFDQVVHDENYYELVKGDKYSDDEKYRKDIRYYNLCLRCGYVPHSKVEDYKNRKVLYYDVHCKCGNSMTMCDWTVEHLDKYIEDRREAEYFNRMYEKDEEFIDKMFDGRF